MKLYELYLFYRCFILFTFYIKDWFGVVNEARITVDSQKLRKMQSLQFKV